MQVHPWLGAEESLVPHGLKVISPAQELIKERLKQDHQRSEQTTEHIDPPSPRSCHIEEGSEHNIENVVFTKEEMYYSSKELL